MDSTGNARARLSINREGLYCAPVLRFLGLDSEQKKWKVSVLVVSSEAERGKLYCSEAEQVGYEVLLKGRYVVEKFLLDIQQAKEERLIPYSILGRTFSLNVPGRVGAIRSAFFSCNGFHEDKSEIEMGGIQAMWQSFNAENSNTPHLLIFGGDQEYFDRVFSLPSLQGWLKLSSFAKFTSPFTEQMDAEVGTFYLDTYVKKFAIDTPFGDALSRTCSIMNWDDHDVFDGWGSYDSKLQNCPVFQGIFKHARANYLLFQQHENPLDPFSSHSFIGNTNFSILRTIDELAILAVDTRSKRTREQILPVGDWQEIFNACKNLPEACKHLYVVLPVPIIYPDISTVANIAETFDIYAETISCVLEKLQCSDLKQFLISPFSTIEILDDFIDAWKNPHHLEERKMLIGKLQEIAKKKSIRITILTGDVHVAGMGEFFDPKLQNKERDAHYMAQVISSPMGNIPVGKVLAFALTLIENTEVIDSHTSARLLPLIREDGTEGKTLISKRNWAELEMSRDTKQVHVALKVETISKTVLGDRRIDKYRSTIPALSLS